MRGGGWEFTVRYDRITIPYHCLVKVGVAVAQAVLAVAEVVAVSHVVLCAFAESPIEKSGTRDQLRLFSQCGSLFEKGLSQSTLLKVR